MIVHRATVIDYSPIAQFGGAKIKAPCDIDGMYEIKDNFLVLECKSGNAQLSIGQRWMLEKLARREGFTVLLVQIKGTRLESGAMLFEPLAYVKMGTDKPAWKRTDIESFVEELSTWQAMAYDNPGKHAFLDLPLFPEYQP